MIKAFFVSLCLLIFCSHAKAQPTARITDDEKLFKTVKEFISKEEYAFAYPLIKDLKRKYPENTASDHTYINDDISYYDVLCELKLMHETGRDAAIQYISNAGNSARAQTLAFHLAHYNFLNNQYQDAITYFDIAGYDNLSNEQIADAKFEKAYSYFNLRQFAQAKPFFNEIHQVAGNKYFIPANYYYGFISYYDKEYDEALTAFKAVETYDEYKGVVPYYIAEIYYFRGDKDRALQYGEASLNNGTPLYYDKQLKLLIGQIYFERKNYSRALPLIEEYVNATPKVSKEVLYELSYSYYATGESRKAIEGFKQLSNENDSMGQNSMYLLGDLYLKTGEKNNARTAFQYSAYNSSNSLQQRVSRFNYAKLSYELGYQDIALNEMRAYLSAYPNSEYDSEAKEIMVSLLTRTSNYSDALTLYESISKPSAAMQKVYPRILYGRAIEYINDQQLTRADELLTSIINNSNAGTVLPYAQFWKGEIAYRQQRYDEAIRFLTLYMQSGVKGEGESNPQAAAYDLGYSYLQKENYKSAQSYFSQVTKSISAASTAVQQDAYVRLTDTYYMLRDYATAGTMYDAAINAASSQSDYALYQQAMIAGIKNSAEKIRILNTINRQYPSNSIGQDINMEIALTYIADEKFADAVPYLNNIIASTDNGLKPRAYLKLGLAYYNSNNNTAAISAYSNLIKKYPQSDEADEAAAIVKDIYVSEGKPDDYVALMQQSGRNVSVSEADSLSYASALNKYNSGDCNASVTSLSNYLQKYPAGSYVLDAEYMRSDCYQKTKDWANAIAGYSVINAAGNSKYFERATLEAARISYFELKDYAKAKTFFQSAAANSSNADNHLEALRGLVRSYYQLKDYSSAQEVSKELSIRKGITTDDRSVALLVLGKSQQLAGDCNAAIGSFRSLAAINKSAWGAEARYEMANCYFTLGNLPQAEKSALSTIKETGSYDEWVTRSYIMLGDIFMQQKDYFNAKATFESVSRNAAIESLKAEAAKKYDAAVAAEKSSSKITNP